LQPRWDGLLSTFRMSLQQDPSSELRVDLEDVIAATWPSVRRFVIQLERASFPPSIRDSELDLDRIASSATSVFIAAYGHNFERELLGYVCGDRLSHFGAVPGARDDASRYSSSSFYISSVAVDRRVQGRGIGMALQRTGIQRAQQKGYRRITAHMRTHGWMKVSPHARALQSFRNWYGTGEQYDYVLLAGH
jgi:ribosomal protein S18 acetylase RimI-like enzyme